jgi:hypothetical protein
MPSRVVQRVILSCVGVFLASKNEESILPVMSRK